VRLLCLRAQDEPPIDDVLAERCEVVEEVEQQSGAGSRTRRARLLAGLLGGKPMWATDHAVSAYARRLREVAERWQPDIVQIEYHVMGQYLPTLKHCPAPRVLVEHEPGAAAARALLGAGSGRARLAARLDLLAWERFERRVLRQVQAVVVFGERDRRALAAVAGPTPIVRIPLGTLLPERALDPLGGSPPSLLFVGSYRHPPNVDAARRLAWSIFPRVRKRAADVKLYVVGDEPPAELRRLADDSVIVTGCVPSVEPYLDRAALVVAPVRLGGGMRVKVLEALAAGKAVVASPLAIEGLDLVDGEQVVVAETDEEFCEATVRLLAEPERRAALAGRARAWACANLGWGRSVAAYEGLYERLTEPKAGQTGQSSGRHRLGPAGPGGGQDARGPGEGLGRLSAGELSRPWPTGDGHLSPGGAREAGR
jgi:glycosyltransferase involved in cell wall biosynthesis